MKEKTKKIIYRTVVFRLFGVAAILVLAACTQPTDSGGANKGFVNIDLDIGEDPSASVQKSVGRTDSAVPGTNENLPEVLRTLLPGSVTYSAFTSYKLVFTPSGGGAPVTLDDRTSLSGIVLDTGTYSLDFTAYTGSKVEAATGTATDIKVEEGKTTPVTVPIVFKPAAGNGTLSFTISRPSGLDLNNAQFVLNPLPSGGTTYGTDWLKILYEGEKKVSHSSSEAVASGYYLVTVTLSTLELRAVKSDIVHIGAGQTTPLEWSFVEATDFSTIVEDIWLLGVNNQWETYEAANKLTEQANGTFAWEGDMSQAYFRFSLDNTSAWGSDKDKPRRFEPASDRTVISFDKLTYMTYVARNTGTPAAWSLGGAGHYRFVVDPYAKTVTVAKPVIVESVAIKNANNELVSTISLPQGTTDYQFTAKVEGKNVELAQISWEISSGTVVSGTAIADGKLTIAEAETVKSTFTITATSTSDTSKSASVTVTVTKKDAQPLPAPTNVVLSDQGVATWTALTDETNVVKYLVHLYKGSDPVGTTQEVSKGGTYSVNFLTAMQGAGLGSYTVKVKAVGDGENYSDSPDATSAAQSVSQKTKVVNVWWFETSKARWVNVDGDSNYTVQLYKGGSAVGSAVSVTRESTVNPGNASETVTTHDFSSTITTPGVYTFGVVTKGNNYLVLDAAETKLADGDAYKYDVKLTAPTNLVWSGTSAQWDVVANASGYSVQLYKDGSTSGSAVEVSSGTSYGSFDVSAAGSYTFKVKAIGNGTAGAGVYLDSDEATSSAKQVGGTASITLIPLEKQAGTLGVSGGGGGSASMAKNGGSLTIAVTGGSFTTFVWVVDGDVVPGETGSTITLSGSAYKLGGHSVTVYALDSDGVPWSPADPIAFTVTAN